MSKTRLEDDSHVLHANHAMQVTINDPTASEQKMHRMMHGTLPIRDNTPSVFDSFADIPQVVCKMVDTSLDLGDPGQLLNALQSWTTASKVHSMFEAIK